MKTTAALVAGIIGAALTVSLGAKTVSVKGTYVEARTEEVFAGGCVMNSEAGTTGREALLAWKVNQGAFEGVSLNGLAVVAAVSGDTNLGIHEIGGPVARTRAALFVDAHANDAQRTALVSMAKRLSNGMLDTVVQVTPTPIQFADRDDDIQISAANV